jgi:hypothetical protein
MAAWDHYAELDFSVMDGLHIHAGYAKGNVVFFSGSNDSGLRVMLASDTTPERFDTAKLAAANEATILGLAASGNTRSLIFEPQIGPETIIGSIIGDIAGGNSLPYAALRGLIAQYEPDAQKSHELAVYQDLGAAFLRSKSSEARVLIPSADPDRPQPESLAL